MSRVLLVSNSDVNINTVIFTLKSANFDEVYHVNCAMEAKLRLSQCEYDLVLINTPLSDEVGFDFAIVAAENSLANVVMLVREEIADAVSMQVENYGIVVIPKPFSKELFFRTLKLIYTTRNRFFSLQNENKKLKNKIEEIRLVARAKYALIEYKNMSEIEAHRYIEKYAMDNRIVRKKAAINILESLNCND